MVVPLHPVWPDTLPETPSQTAGPYVHIGLTPGACGIDGVHGEDLGRGPLYEDGAEGERVVLVGRLVDGAGAPMGDALVELWQADARGRHPSPTETRGRSDPRFRGWGRCATDADGEFRFETVKPGRVPFGDGRLQAPHASLWIAARGINLALHTRLYFGDEPDANAEDPLLNLIPDPRRRATLIASCDGDAHRLDIHLQGPDETVFLDI